MNTVYTIGLTLCTTLLFILLAINSNYKKKKQINKAFILVIICLLICCMGQLASLLFDSNFNVPPIYFDYFVYIGTCFLPVAFLYFSNVFIKTKVNLKRWHLLLLIIPILSLLILWTNDSHHLFYVKYSLNTDETIFGTYFYIHTAYTYALLFIAIVSLLKYTIKNSGFFSKQSIFIVIGSIIPIAINLLGVLGIPMSIYLTPMSFTVMILFYAFSILKFRFLSVTPIALQRIVDRISDGYAVLNEDYNIIDFNQTFTSIFNLSGSNIRNNDFFSIIDSKFISEKDLLVIKDFVAKSQGSKLTSHLDIKLVNCERFFNVEVNSILSNNDFLGTLILLKETTQHMLDLETIKDNQNMLMERERLASLGQLIGGIAHNLKTPIMSIAGAAEGLFDLVKEYDTSIGDADVTHEDHHAIAKDMDDWIEKIKAYTEYMSDVITAVKGQAVTLSDEQSTSFDIEELLKRINLLMRHELKNAHITLNFVVNVDSSTTLHGNINSLVQVINNMISNAIQAYNGVANKDIDLIVEKVSNTIVISVKDYGIGLPKEVQEKLFKEMITTKGKNGTGLGLFMSYSTIRAHFNGNITFETKKGEGTKFNIILPCS